MRNLSIVSAVLAVLVVAGVSLYFGVIKRTDYEGEVTRVYWERSALVEQEQPIRKEGWEVPANARVLEKERKFKNYTEESYDVLEVTVSVPTDYNAETDGPLSFVAQIPRNYYADMDSVPEDEYQEGTFFTYRVANQEETEKGDVKFTLNIFKPVAVNADWYIYEVMEWKPLTTLSLDGNDSNPSWPDMAAFEAQVRNGSGPDGSIRDGKLREGRRSEQYTVYFETSGDGSARGKEYSKKISSVADWQRYKVGDRYTLSVNAVGSVEIR
ncbi:MAG: hypothetical protein KDD64_07265 [Bdellovibrionales bacterium]|nr:hypothetical protein [Bdellovibrionales bacterium]